jgi:hypothetical protein
MDVSPRYPSTVGRKPIYDREGEPLQLYSAKLFLSQIRFLREMGKGRGSAWVREQIALGMKREARRNRPKPKK